MTRDHDDVFRELRRLSPKVTGELLRMREESYRDGVVPAKYKVLTALVISIAIRCEPCIQAYVRMADELGATEEELMEFLNVAMTMQGCPGEEWALKAYAMYRETTAKIELKEHAGCCVQTDEGDAQGGEQA